MKVSNRNFLLLLSLTSLLSACEVKKNVDEMHGATVEMNDTTKTMNENTEELKTAAGELYDALRQGDSLAARRAALHNLVKTKDPARKLSEAAKYFMSFEYQFWNNNGQDKGTHRRDEMATEAAREFFKDVQQFIPDMDMSPKPLAGQILSTKKSNLVNSLNALSVTMHFLNPKQEVRVKADPKMGKLSMNKIIEDSLLAKESIESGEKKFSDYPGYVEEVLTNEAIAVYILEARYNYMTALFLAKTTNIAHSKLAATRSLWKEWTLDLTKFNLAQTEEIAKLLSGALKTKKTLQTLGVSVRIDAILARILKNMKLDSSHKMTLATKVSLDEKILKDIDELKQF